MVTKKPKKWVRQALILSALKKLFVRSPIYKAIKDSAKVPYTAKKKDGTDSKAKRFQYQCNICKKLFLDSKITLIGKDGTPKKKKLSVLQVDHILPVIDPETGYRGLEDWVEREFAGINIWDPKNIKPSDIEYLKTRLQLICHTCHFKKSEQENQIRRKKIA